MTRHLLFSYLLGILILASCGEDPSEAPMPGINGLTACISPLEENYLAGTVIFFSSCSENAESYRWDFGNGAISTNEHPTYKYGEAGNYLVTLTVSDGTNSISATQKVTIGLPDYILHRGTIIADETWSASVTHVVENRVYIEDGATLTIEAGATVKFKEYGSIAVGYAKEGGLVAEGRASAPILFTSFQATPAPGDWDGFSIGGHTFAPAVFRHCIFEYAGNDMFGDATPAIDIYDGGQVNVDFCEFKNLLSYAVRLDDEGGFHSFTNNYIHDLEDFALSITGNYAGTIGEKNNFDNKGVLIDIHHVTMDTEWRGLNCPYVTKSNLWIGSETGNTVVFSEGVRIEFQDTQMLLPHWNSSTIMANGTAENPVVFTAHDPDASSRWGGVILGAGVTSESYFRHTIFEKAQDSRESEAIITVNAPVLNMEHCKFNGNKAFSVDLSAETELGTFDHNDFGATGRHAIRIKNPLNIAKLGTGNTFSGNNFVEIDFTDYKIDGVWPAIQTYYFIDSDLYFGSVSGMTVAFNPGLKMIMTGNSSLYIGAGYNTIEDRVCTFKAIGTSVNPIQIERRATTTGNYALMIFNGDTFAKESTVEYCVLDGGTSGIRVINVYNPETNKYPIIKNNTIKNSTGKAIYVANSFPYFENNTFLNNEFDGVFYQ